MPYQYAGVTVNATFIGWLAPPCVTRFILVYAQIKDGTLSYQTNQTMMKESLGFGLSIGQSPNPFRTSRPITGMIEIYQTQTTNFSVQGGSGLSLSPSSVTASTFLQENNDFTVGADGQTINLNAPAITGAQYLAFYETQAMQFGRYQIPDQFPMTPTTP